MNLLHKKCVPCEEGSPPLAARAIARLRAELSGDWIVEGDKKLIREFTFRDFMEAMTFVNKVAQIAEDEGHHPDIHIFYNKVRIELWTHAVNGLSENDFILAAKISAIHL